VPGGPGAMFIMIHPHVAFPLFNQSLYTIL